MDTTKTIDGSISPVYVVPLSNDEIVEYESSFAKQSADYENTIAARISAINKLTLLGLTEDEIAALVG